MLGPGASHPGFLVPQSFINPKVPCLRHGSASLECLAQGRGLRFAADIITGWHPCAILPRVYLCAVLLLKSPVLHESGRFRFWTWLWHLIVMWPWARYKFLWVSVFSFVKWGLISLPHTVAVKIGLDTIIVNKNPMILVWVVLKYHFERHWSK